MPDMEYTSYALRKLPRDELLVGDQYGQDDPSSNLDPRWKVYEQAKPHVDSLDLMYGMARKYGVGPDDVVLDAGCNNAADLIRLREDFGHTGVMYGVDPFVRPDAERIRPHLATEDSPGIIPLQRRIEAVGDNEVRPHSVGLGIAKYMVYHVRPPEAVLLKFQHLMTAKGVLLVATSGQSNKLRHREFEAAIAARLRVDAPAPFNGSFTAEIAERILPRYFDVMERHPSPAGPRFATASYDTKNYREYLSSLVSMRVAFHPQPEPGEFMRAIREVVVPVILGEIATAGRFVERIDRRYYVCMPLGSVGVFAG